MARLGCKCGAEMTNTISPSENRLNIYYMKEAMDAINSYPQIKLWDFYTGWDEKNSCNSSFMDREEPVEYWYCNNCKRVYEVQAKSCGKITRVYCASEEIHSVDTDYSSLTELLVLTDVEMDKLLSLNEKMTLQEYMNQIIESKVYISSDEKTVYITNKNAKKNYVYLRED